MLLPGRRTDGAALGAGLCPDRGDEFVGNTAHFEYVLVASASILPAAQRVAARELADGGVAAPDGLAQLEQRDAAPACPGSGGFDRQVGDQIVLRREGECER